MLKKILSFSRSSKIRSSIQYSFAVENILDMRDLSVIPKVNEIFWNDDFESDIYISVEGNLHDKLISSHQSLSAALRGRLSHYEFSQGIDVDGGNFVKFVLRDTSHSFRLSPKSLREWSPISKGNYPFMENRSIDFNLRPHMLISGATQSGKSYLLVALLLCMIRDKANIFTIDPKNAELAKISRIVLKNGSWTALNDNQVSPEKIMDKVINIMISRQIDLEKIQDIEATAIKSLNRCPVFLVIEELSSTVATMSAKNKSIFLGKLQMIAQRGRSAGVFLILLSQNVTVEAFGNSAIRDQMMNRIILGNSSATQRASIFPPGIAIPSKKFKSKSGLGWAYFDGDDSISQVESPTLKFSVIDSLKYLKNVHNK